MSAMGGAHLRSVEGGRASAAGATEDGSQSEDENTQADERLLTNVGSGSPTRATK